MKAFIAAHGQPDNLGDSVLRRAMLDAFLHPAVERHILVGSGVSDYAAGLGLTREDRIYTSRSRWQRAVLKAGLSDRVAFVTNAGEVQLNGRRAKIALADIPTAALVRLRGGMTIQTGMAFRVPHGPFPWQIAIVSRLSRLATWRDSPSRDYAGTGEVTPDWAFALIATGDAVPKRDLLVVTMRGDRPEPTSAFLKSIEQLGAERGLRPVVINQVVRDKDRSRMIADALDAEFMSPWSGGPHDDFERVIRNIYARAELVISDRLHALVIGLTEGAAPVGMTSGSSEKLDRTFAGAEIHDVSFDFRDLDAGSIVNRANSIADRREALVTAAENARERLDELGRRMRSLLVDPQ
jgi:polysaccharide pyruvyl transferase WcaK-like protein